MSPFSSWFASPVPDAAIEISAQRVSVAALTARGGTYTVQRRATESLPHGLVTPSLTSSNIADPARVSEALRSAFREFGENPKRVILVLPDTVARVSLVPFAQVPARAEDLDELIRWQLRKSAPFSIDEAVVSHTPGARGMNGSEFVVALARRSVVQEYERACELAGAHAGVVDLATLSVVNLFLAGNVPSAADWLVVNVRPDYTSLAIMRGRDLVFFRSRVEADGESLSDLVHQTAMYYEDRLSGRGFERVFLGGGRGAAAELARDGLEERLGVSVEPIDASRAVSFADRIRLGAETSEALAPLVGALLREQRRTAA